MPKKAKFEDYVTALLNKQGCKNIQVNRDTISAQCPYHFPKKNHKTFHVSRKPVHKTVDGDVYCFNCFSCGKSGSIFKLISHIEKCSFKKAVKLFEKHVVLDSITMNSLKNELEHLKKKSDEESLDIIELPPMHENQSPMYEYMDNRSRMYHSVLDVDWIVKKYNLYYCGTGRERGRIIMPIENSQGEYVCFNDRTVQEHVKNKSLHIRGYPYGKLLYGLQECIDKRSVIVVEGAFDVYQVMCAIQSNSGFRKQYGVVGLMGSVMTEERIVLLLKNFHKILLLGDHDEEGVKWSYNAYRELDEDADVYLCTENLYKKKDPGKCTKREILKAISKPYKPERKTYLDWIVEKYEFKM